MRVHFMSGPEDGKVVYLTTNLPSSKSDSTWREGAIGDSLADIVYPSELDRQGLFVYSIGRDNTCAICIPYDMKISKKHAQILIDKDNKYWLEDMGSTNGTYIPHANNKSIEKRKQIELKDKAFFRIGKTLLMCEIVENEK